MKEHLLVVIGIGHDGPAGLSAAARAYIAAARVLAGGRRHLDFFPEWAGERVVSSQSLATYVEEHLPDYAALSAGKKQTTEIASGFRYKTNDYLKLPHLARPPGKRYDRPTSAPTTTPPEADPVAKLERALDASQSEWRQDFWRRTDLLIEQQRQRPNLVIEIAGAGHHDIQRAAETVSLTTPNNRALNYDTSTFPDSPAILIWIDDYRAAFEKGRPFAPLLSIGRLHIPLELQSHPQTIVLSLSLKQPYDGNARGVDALGWNAEYSRNEGTAYRPMEVLKGLMTGVLTADLVQPLAAQLRQFKHSDPLYGIAAAYLYDRIGDLDGIRRMCLFYAKHKQGIPFDIALLSRLKFNRERGRPGFRVDVPDIPEDRKADKDRLPKYVWRAMAGRKALTVAGLVPILQADWARLATLRPHPLFHKFRGLRDHLTNAPFATFEGKEAYKGLLTLFELADSRY